MQQVRGHHYPLRGPVLWRDLQREVRRVLVGLRKSMGETYFKMEEHNVHNPTYSKTIICHTLQLLLLLFQVNEHLTLIYEQNNRSYYLYERLNLLLFTFQVNDLNVSVTTFINNFLPHTTQQNYFIVSFTRQASAFRPRGTLPHQVKEAPSRSEDRLHRHGRHPPSLSPNHTAPVTLLLSLLLPPLTTILSWQLKQQFPVIIFSYLFFSKFSSSIFISYPHACLTLRQYNSQQHTHTPLHPRRCNLYTMWV